jgi:hypothetical protein
MSYDNPLIFYENTTYLGGLYEMYEIISRYWKKIYLFIIIWI